MKLVLVTKYSKSKALSNRLQIGETEPYYKVSKAFLGPDTAQG